MAAKRGLLCVLVLFGTAGASHGAGYCVFDNTQGTLDLAQCDARNGAFLPEQLNQLSKLASSGDPKDYFRLAQWLESSAELAQRKLAVNWYQLSANRGHVAANYALASLYENGDLVAHDLIKAHRLYLAAQTSNDKARPEILSLDAGRVSNLAVASLENSLKVERLKLARGQQLVTSLSKELKSAEQALPVGEELKFSILSAEQRVKRAEQELENYSADQRQGKLADLKSDIEDRNLADDTLDSLAGLVDDQLQDLAMEKSDLARQQQQVARLRSGRAMPKDQANVAVLAMESTQGKDQALKQYLNDLENSVQHRKVSQQREQKKLDFLEKRIARLKRQNTRKIKADDQVLLERALSQMDTRYQGEIEYLADNLQQEVSHTKRLKSELKVVEQQAKNDRKLVATISQRLEDAADLVDRQSELVERQSQDLSLAIEKMNEAHSKPVKAAQLWAADMPVQPEISLKWPDFSADGKDWVVEASAGSSLRLVGAVQGASSLKSFSVDGEATSLDKNGLFVATIDVFDQAKWVSLKAINKQGEQVTQRVRIEPQQPPVARSGTATPAVIKDMGQVSFGNYHALVIGNNQYGDGGFEMLDTAVNDAESMASLLKDQYGFDVQVVLNATRDQMLSAMEAMRSKLTDVDNLLIYYAGHGIMDAENNQGYWVPIDGRVDSSVRWISNATITDQIRAMTARNVMVVADSCYSGSLMRSGMMYVRSGLTPEKKVKRISEDVAAATRVVLSSGGLQPVIDSIDGNPNSVFTSAMLKSLRGNQELLDADSLATNVSHAVAMATADTVKQVPRFAPLIRAGHEGGEFYFVPKAWRDSQSADEAGSE